MDDFGAWEAGAAFALAGVLADSHAAKINRAIQEAVDGRSNSNDDAAGDIAPFRPQTSWDAYIGQEPMKRMLRVHIDAAKARKEPLPHVLLASGAPGVGKTEMGKLIASEMRSAIAIVVPPFTRDQFLRIMGNLHDFDVLLLDEIHKLVDNGKKNAEILLHLLEEGRHYGAEGTIEFPRITVIGATTDLDRLPETIIGRFPIRPPFTPYTHRELALITAKFEGEYGVRLPFEVTIAIAQACRGTPRVAREMVMAARDLHAATGEHPTPSQLLEFVRTDPNGMTDEHKTYLTTLYRNFSDHTSGVENLTVMLRQTKQGILRLERFLIEQGYVELTSRGRTLTKKGVDFARRESHGTQ